MNTNNTLPVGDNTQVGDLNETVEVHASEGALNDGASTSTSDTGIEGGPGEGASEGDTAAAVEPTKPLTREQRRAAKREAKLAAEKAAQAAVLAAANAAQAAGTQAGEADTGTVAGLPAIVPLTAVKGENLRDVGGYDLTLWPSRDDAVNSTPYYVGVSVLDQSIIDVNDIPTGTRTFVDVVPDDLGLGEQAYCLLHWRDCVRAIQALGFTNPKTMIEATAACYLLNGFGLTTTEWQSTVGQRVWRARGESKCNWAGPNGPAAKFATQQKGVTFGNTSRMRIELGYARINGGLTPVDMVRAAFKNEGRALPLILVTGYGYEGLYLPRSTPARFKWHPAGFNAAGDLIDYEHPTAVSRASLKAYVQAVIERKAA